ncbi:MAG: hypothetical protein A2Y62_02570 [Candidatus Fischerbacteria bacterium RBG_13_37_8]|uniref:Bulb-type lectin domain-containing protein n=1 Tax=Candidatus Fischerbacteria bacterium RBG_13_37_8 TaxID=1817863 RepID=A0A1F5V6T9_9BACT|nr:MAG: hypothetical protein A2Y62_02570 [Candidatus Fischerbacteria bacterium RBG_13_37_8]
MTKGRIFRKIEYFNKTILGAIRSTKVIRRIINIASSINLFIMICILWAPGEAFAQLTWAHTYGGNNIEIATAILQTNDSGYIAAGYTNSFSAGSYDVWIFKLDASGAIVWQKTFGGSDADYAYSIQQTNDNCYIIAATTLSFGVSKLSTWVLKIDSAGNIIWQKIYSGSIIFAAKSIQQTSDDGYILAGYAEYQMYVSDIWILKLDSSGNIIWQNIYGTQYEDYGYNIKQTSDGGFIVAGTSHNLTWLLKLDNTGNVSWQRRFSFSPLNSLSEIIETNDGGYIATGFYNGTYSKNDDIWIVKLTCVGMIEWEKIFGGTGSDYGTSILQTINGEYIVAGSASSFGAGGYDICIMKIDQSGSIIWQKTYGWSSFENAYSIQETNDSGFVIAGRTGTESVIIKIDSNGEMDTSCTFINDTNITPTSPPVYMNSTDVIGVTEPSATANDSTVSGINSNATDTVICQSMSIPVLLSHKAIVDDSNSAYPNGIIEEDEIVNLIGLNQNIGSANSPFAVGLLSSFDPIIINNGVVNYPECLPGMVSSSANPFPMLLSRLQ